MSGSDNKVNIQQKNLAGDGSNLENARSISTVNSLNNNNNNNLTSGSTSSNSSQNLVSGSTQNNQSVHDAVMEYQVTAVYLNDDGQQELFGFNTEEDLEDWCITVREIKRMANEIYDDGERMQMEGNDRWYLVACGRYRRWLMEIEFLIRTFGRSHVPQHLQNSMRNVEQQLGIEVTFPEDGGVAV